MNPESPYWEALKSRTSGYTNIGCGDGWDNLIRMVDGALKEIDPDYQIAQIKEKFGGLRYYIGLSDRLTDEQRDLVYDVLRLAEALSYKTCERCGTTEDVETKAWVGKYWIKTYCPACANTAREERASLTGELTQKSDAQ